MLHFGPSALEKEKKHVAADYGEVRFDVKESQDRPWRC